MMRLAALLLVLLLPLQAHALACLLVVANSASPSAGESALETLIEAHGHTCTLISDETADPGTGYDFVVISMDVDEGALLTKYSAITQPMWVGSRFIALNRLMYSGGNGAVAAAINVQSAQNGNAYLGGLNSSGNPITIATSGTIGVITGTAASGAVVLANDGEDNGPAYLYIPQGAALTSGNSPNLRIFIEFETSVANLNASGTAIVDAIVDGIETEIGGGAGGGELLLRRRRQ